MLHQESPGVHARPVAAIPAERALPHGLLQRRHRAGDARALLGHRQLIVLLPAPAMAADIVPGGADRRGRRRVAFQCQSAAEHRQRQGAFRKQPHDPPEADPAAIGEHALGRKIAAWHVRVDAAILGQAPFRGRVAIGHRRFRAFLEVQHKVQREAGAARPFWVGRVGAVADQVAVHVAVLSVTVGRGPRVTVGRGPRVMVGR